MAPPGLNFGTTKPRALNVAAPKLNFAPTRPMSLAPTAAPTGGGSGIVIAPPGQSSDKPKPRSLWNQLTDVVTGVIPGAINLAKTAIETSPIGWGVRAGYRAAEGKPIKFNPLSEDYSPLYKQMAQSFVNTGTDVIHPTRFIKAIEEGRIVDKVLEDVGNVALVAGPVTKGLTAVASAADAAGYSGLASGLETAAKGTGYAHRLGNTVADAPISVPRRLVTAIGEGGRTAVNTLAEGEGMLSGPAASLRDMMPATFTEQGSILNRGLRDAYASGGRAKARVARELFTEGGAAERNPAFTDAEQGAATAILSGIGHADQIQRLNNPHLDPEQIRVAMVGGADVPEQTFTPDVAEVTRAYLDDTIDSESKARVDRHMAALQSVAGKSQERALAGVGRFKGPLDPALLGSEPVDKYVADALKEAGVDQATIDSMNERRANGEAWGDIEQDHPELGDVLDNPMVYPKQWRPAMRAMALGNENAAAVGGAQLGYRPEDLMGHGMPEPTYLSSAPSNLAQPIRTMSSGERTNRGMSGFQGLSSENQAVSNKYLPFSARTQAEAFGREAERTAFNEAMFRTVNDANLPTVSGVLGDQQTQIIIDQATKEAKAQRFSQLQTDRLIGSRLNEALLDAGHSPIIGDLANPQPGDFNMSGRTNLEQINGDTPAIQTAVKNKLEQRWANRGGGVPGQVMDWINKKFKGNVLPFSMRWQMGDAIGGAFMAWAGGGVNPAEFLGKMRELKHLDPEAMQQMFEHPDFADMSLTHGEQQIINQGPDRKAPRTPIGKFKEASFRVNNKINELNRHAYVLAKTDQLLAEHGLSVDKLRGNEAEWAKPEVQRAVKLAVDDAMKVMGDFDEMSPFEQRVMKRIFPFWAWNRHITALAWRTAIDNPARMMWTMRLGSYGSDPNSDLPAFLKGGLPLTKGLSIPTSSLNPFADVLGGEPIYTPQGALRSMSPGIKLGVAALTGADTSKGLNPITRPYGSGWVDDQGRPRNTPLITKPLELAYQAANVLPISRVAMSMLPTSTIHSDRLGTVGFGPVGHLGSGAPLPQYTDPRIMKLLPLLGIPVTTKPTSGK